MISSLFNNIGTIVTNVVTLFGSLFNSVVSLIYDGEGLTDIGILFLIGASVGLVMFVFNMVRNLIKVRA